MDKFAIVYDVGLYVPVVIAPFDTWVEAYNYGRTHPLLLGGDKGPHPYRIGTVTEPGNDPGGRG